MAFRADSFHKLLFLHSGQLRYADSARKTTLVEPGGWWPVERGQRHRLEDERPATLLLLGLGANWVLSNPERSRLWNQIIRRRPRVSYPHAYLRNALERRWRRMLVEQHASRLGGNLLLSAEADRMLIDAARIWPRTARLGSTERLQQVIRMLQERYFESWSLDEAAHRAELSRRSFSTLFRSQTGKTFLKYLTDLRLRHARERLADPGHTIAGAAFSSGFEDLSHFYRVFRRAYGRTPGAYRDQVR